MEESLQRATFYELTIKIKLRKTEQGQEYPDRELVVNNR